MTVERAKPSAPLTSVPAGVLSLRSEVPDYSASGATGCPQDVV